MAETEHFISETPLVEVPEEEEKRYRFIGKLKILIPI